MPFLRESEYFRHDSWFMIEDIQALMCYPIYVLSY